MKFTSNLYVIKHTNSGLRISIKLLMCIKFVVQNFIITDKDKHFNNSKNMHILIDLYIYIYISSIHLVLRKLTIIIFYEFYFC